MTAGTRDGEAEPRRSSNESVSRRGHSLGRMLEALCKATLSGIYGEWAGKKSKASGQTEKSVDLVDHVDHVVCSRLQPAGDTGSHPEAVSARKSTPLPCIHDVPDYRVTARSREHAVASLHMYEPRKPRSLEWGRDALREIFVPPAPSSTMIPSSKPRQVDKRTRLAQSIGHTAVVSWLTYLHVYDPPEPSAGLDPQE